MTRHLPLEQPVDTPADNEEAFESGAASVDITSDNQEAFDEGAASVDITSDNAAAFDEGAASVDITSDNSEVYKEGYTDGANSVDITTDNQTAYDEGFGAGVESVDITTDNPAAYEKATDGANSVDITTDNQGVYDQAYAAGAESVDITSNDEAIATISAECTTCVDVLWLRIPKIRCGVRPVRDLCTRAAQPRRLRESIQRRRCAVEACPVACLGLELSRLPAVSQNPTHVETLLDETFASGVSSVDITSNTALCEDLGGEYVTDRCSWVGDDLSFDADMVLARPMLK